MKSYAVQAVRDALELAAQQVPHNWLDPLLTGPNAVGEYDSKIEPLLIAIAERIRALLKEYSDE